MCPKRKLKDRMSWIEETNSEPYESVIPGIETLHFTSSGAGSFLKHMLVPIFGIVANLICMGAYIVLPFFGYGTKMEPFLALGIAALWAIYGGIYFLRSSKVAGRTTLVTSRT